MGGAAGPPQQALGGGGRCPWSPAEREAVARWRDWKVRRRRDAGRAAGAGRSSRGAPDSGTAEAREGPERRIPPCLRGSGRLEPDGPDAVGLPIPRLPASHGPQQGLATPPLILPGARPVLPDSSVPC